jgi:hypothetical protein
MYTPGTILELNDQRPNDSETDEVFPYNRVKVVGPSPINHGAGAQSEWSGAAGAGVIITPESNFGSTLDEPLGKLQALYTVVSVPEVLVDARPQVRVISPTTGDAGPTPEEIFAKEAPGDPDAPRRPGAIKAAAESPLVDPRPKPSDGPLGPVSPEAGVEDTGQPVQTSVI